MTLKVCNLSLKVEKYESQSKVLQDELDKTKAKLIEAIATMNQLEHEKVSETCLSRCNYAVSYFT
jgi:hypothetical protein